MGMCGLARMNLAPISTVTTSPLAIRSFEGDAGLNNFGLSAISAYVRVHLCVCM